MNPDAGQVVGRARECVREIDCIELFISEDIQASVVNEMNSKISSFIEDNQGKTGYPIPDYTNIMEFKAFIGLWFARAFFEWNDWEVE